jgi:hypothetical protein
LFSVTSPISPSFHYEYNIFVDPYFVRNNYLNHNYERIANTIINLIEDSIQSQLQNILFSQEKMYTKFFQENNTIYIKDESTAFFLDLSSTKEQFEVLLQINQKVSS